MPVIEGLPYCERLHAFATYTAPTIVSGGDVSPDVLDDNTAPPTAPPEPEAPEEEAPTCYTCGGGAEMMGGPHVYGDMTHEGEVEWFACNHHVLDHWGDDHWIAEVEQGGAEDSAEGP